MTGELEARAKPNRCPACGGPKIAAVLYGLPALDDEVMAELDRGELILGGCLTSERDPAWQCVDCKVSIYRAEDAC